MGDFNLPEITQLHRVGKPGLASIFLNPVHFLTLVFPWNWVNVSVYPGQSSVWGDSHGHARQGLGSCAELLSCKISDVWLD